MDSSQTEASSSSCSNADRPDSRRRSFKGTYLLCPTDRTAEVCFRFRILESCTQAEEAHGLLVERNSPCVQYWLLVEADSGGLCERKPFVSTLQFVVFARSKACTCWNSSIAALWRSFSSGTPSSFSIALFYNRKANSRPATGARPTH